MISLARWPKVEDLRKKLNGKAKAKPEYRFYSLYDKVYRKDFLEAAWAQGRHNDGCAGVDEKDFEDIEAYGVQRYLAELAAELKELRYRPQPVRRVMIPKANQPGKYRPLGIPTIRDRIVQQAVKLLLEPIFEADFPDNMYGYRAGKSAQDAVRDVDQGLRHREVDVVDADLSKYLDHSSHCTPFHKAPAKRGCWLSKTLMRKPLRRPWLTWMASSSPRVTRCNTVCRETPSLRMAAAIGTKSSGASAAKRRRSSPVI